jgi:hypothetical protein
LRYFVLEWQTEPARYIFFVTLLILTIISLLPQAGAEWTTSILSMSRRLSILYYSNEDKQNDRSTSSKRLIRYRHYLFALFIGFQEGYFFGSIIKVIKKISNKTILIFHSHLSFRLILV